MYYSFTTLSTVGFGDFHPRGNHERIIACFVLMFGVAIFSYIMGNFISILDSFKEMNSIIDEGDSLARFLGLLKRFNGNKDINSKLTEKILLHFDSRWKLNKLSAFESECDSALY